jgi:hypothetical protein
VQEIATMKSVLGPATVAVGLVLGLAGGSARAQMPYPYESSRPLYDLYNRPNLSPYLNLLRRGDPATNYYLGVIPEYDRRNWVNRSLEQFQNLYQRTERAPQELVDPLLREPVYRTNPPTGHATGFLNYGTYFNMPRR